jgi:hypothetical protein
MWARNNPASPWPRPSLGDPVTRRQRQPVALAVTGQPDTDWRPRVFDLTEFGRDNDTDVTLGSR